MHFAYDPRPNNKVMAFFLTFMESCIARCVFYITNDL